MKMIAEDYVCTQGHTWKTGWAKGVPKENRYDCCEQCMNQGDLRMYAPMSMAVTQQTVLDLIKHTCELCEMVALDIQSQHHKDCDGKSSIN